MINATSLSTGSHFYQRPAQRVLPAQYLRTFSAVTQGLGEIWAELGASTRNHSQIVKTLFPCELMPFLPLFMETAQHYLATSGMTLSLPVSFPLKTRTLSEAFPSWDDLPRPRDRHRDRLRPPGQNEWVHVKIFEAEAKQGPFQKHRPLPPFAPPSYFYSSLRVWSFGNEPDVSGVSVQPRRSLGGGNSERKQCSSFPRLLSPSVNLHHVCAWWAKLFYIRGSRLYFNSLCDLTFGSLPSPLFSCQIADLSNPLLQGSTLTFMEIPTDSGKENFSSSQA